MERQALVAAMTELLQEAVEQEGEHSGVVVDSTSPLVGGDAVLSSMALVSYIIDLETALADQHEIEIVLVSENALSRSKSPFRTVETLADYVLELAAEARGESAA